DESLRQAGLALQRPDRDGCGEGRLRRDPVRLRALPERRRYLADPLSRHTRTAAGLYDPDVRQVRGRTPASTRGAHLDGGVRALRDPRPRHRAVPAADLALRRLGLSNGVPVALR